MTGIRKKRISAGLILIAVTAVLAGIIGCGKTISGQGTAPEPGNTEATVSTETEAVNPGTEGTVSLVMIGDLLLHDDIERLSRRDDGTYDYTDLFVHIKDRIQEADLALADDEVIIGGEKLGVSGYPRFNAPYELADDLVETGFDVVLYANNHANDMGKEAILNCIGYWSEKHPYVAVLGIHDSRRDAKEIYVCERNGIRIAILNYTELLNMPVDGGYPWMVDMLQEESKIRSDIRKARESADFVIVIPHWGTEYSNGIDDNQKKWTQVFLEEGVDLVIGSHPHVIQKIETVEDASSGHRMTVYYSLGNYVSWIGERGTEVQKREIGGLASVTIGRNKDGTVGIRDYGIEPLICHIAADKDAMTVYPYGEYAEELAAGTLAAKLTGDFSMTYIDAYLDSIWGDLWRR